MNAELYAELLQPIKDIEKNWKIDVNMLLSTYLEETSQTSVESIDFIFASSIIEGAANLWGQKVDNLVSECKKLLEMMSNNIAELNEDQKKRSYVRKSRSRKKVGQVPVLKRRADTFVDPSKVCEPVNKVGALKIRSNFEDIPRGSTLTYSSIAYNQATTNFYDSLLNRCIITCDGIVCRPEHLSSVYDDEDSSTAGRRSEENPVEDDVVDENRMDEDHIEDDHIEEDHMEEDHMEDDHMEDDATQMNLVDCKVENQEEDDVVEEFVVGNHSEKSGTNEVFVAPVEKRRKFPIILISDYLNKLNLEPFQHLDLDKEPENWINQPPKVRKRCYITREMIEKAKNSPLPSLVSTINEFTQCPRGYGSLALQAEKRPSELRMKKRFKEMSKMLKQTSTPTSNSDQNVDYNDAEDDVECFFRNDEVVDISSDDDDVVDSDDDGVDENYIQVPQDFNISVCREVEDIFSNHVDNYFDKLNIEAETNQLLETVHEWEKRVLPYLDACNNQNSLNVKKRSEELLSKMSKKNKEDILFSDLLDDDDTELTARSSFVTLLHLLNDGNIEIEESQGLIDSNDIKIKLLNQEIKDKEFAT